MLANISKNVEICLKSYFWCGQRESNSHGHGPHGPQPCLSTNFSMTAYNASD